MAMSDFGLRLLGSVAMAEEVKSGNLGSLESGGNVTSVTTGETSLVFEASECKAETVVVYLDRAEVCRTLRATVKRGENEIILKGLSSCIDKDSIRVEGRGPATISEVAFQTKPLTPQEETSSQEKSKQLCKDLEQLQLKKSVLDDNKHRLQKQRNVLDGFADNVVRAGGGSGSQTKENGPTFLSSDVLQGMVGFFGLYDKQAARLDVSLQEVNKDISQIDEQINALKKNLMEMNASTQTKEARELSVLLDCTKEDEVELYVSYVVTKAKWTPKYDIRVFSNDKQIKIMYFGMIQQATGEDWVDTKLCLSTAMPSIGGTIPDLGTQKLSFKPRTRYLTKSASFLGRASLRVAKSRNKRYAAADDGAVLNDLRGMAWEESDEDGSFQLPPPPPPMQFAAAEVKESIATTMYEIARRSSIPCDNVGHKVSVAIIDLKPNFEYESVPKRAANAFLKARVKNTSPYALLAGPTNVFLDNNFIAKAELKAVSPSEDFTCSLGVDPAVKVTYKPVHKYREQSGIISKTSSTLYKQVIEVKNTHQENIKVVVIDQLPLSTEEKIKVTMLEPVIKHPEKYDMTKPSRLNKMNNVEWEVELAPGEAKELLLKYTIEHPVAEEVDSSVTHFNHSTTSSEV